MKKIYVASIADKYALKAGMCHVQVLKHYMEVAFSWLVYSFWFAWFQIHYKQV